MEVIDTIFGRYLIHSKNRLDLTYDYETAAIRSFKDIADRLEVTHFLDVGANIGVYSVYLSSLDSLSTVHAFEPAPEACRLLDGNLRLQEKPELFTIHNCAASDKSGTVPFRIVGPMAGNNRIVAEGSNAGSTDVKSLRIDDVLKLEGVRAAIKIDVEGHEASAIIGADQFFRRNFIFAQIECLGEDQSDVVERLLTERGLRRIFRLNNDHYFISDNFPVKIDNAIQQIFERSLALDLADLTRLRSEKRKLAAEAKRLWIGAGYRRDPVLS